MDEAPEEGRVLLPGAPIPADGIGAYPLFLHSVGVALRNLPTLGAIYLPLAATSTVLLLFGAPTLMTPNPSVPSSEVRIPPNEWIAMAGWAMYVFSVGTWSSVALFRSAHSALTTGRALGFGAAYGSAIERVPSFFATQLLFGLTVIAGLIACCVPGIWFAVLFAPALPRSATRPVGPIRSLRESKALVHGRFWRTAGFVALVGITAYALNMPYFATSYVLPHVEEWSRWLRLGVGTITTALVGVIQMTAYAALHERLEETA